MYSTSLRWTLDLRCCAITKLDEEDRRRLRNIASDGFMLAVGGIRWSVPYEMVLKS